MDRIKVLIADDHTLFRRGLVEILGREERLEIVGQASDGDEAVEMARTLKPHIVLMDVHMPKCNGIEATRLLQAEIPETKVLILTVSALDTDLIDALRAGARGYMLKDEEPDQLVQAIYFVAGGGTLVSSTMAAALLRETETEQPRVASPPLSPVEEEVLRLLARDNSDMVIAYRLSTTDRVVTTHLSNILHKLRFGTRRELVSYAKHAVLAVRDEQSGVRGIASGVLDKHRAKTNGSVDTHAAAERRVSKGVKDTLELPEGEIDSADPTTTPTVFTLSGVVELIIEPPWEPTQALRLHHWLQEVGKAVIQNITGSWGTELVLKINIREPIPLFGMLTELPIVTKITAEPDTGGAEPRRIRLALGAS